MAAQYILKNVLFFCTAFKYSMGISKLSHCTFLHRVNTFGEKNRLLFSKIREREKMIL